MSLILRTKIWYFAETLHKNPEREHLLYCADYYKGIWVTQLMIWTNYLRANKPPEKSPIKSRIFFMPSLIMRYCTCVQISFAISERKIFLLALNKRQSATSLYCQFPKYQSSHLQKNNFFWNVSFCVCFVNKV